MSDSYVCSKAKIKCSCGDKISTLTVFPDRTIWLTGEPQANISDHISMKNIAPFGRCHTTAYPATGAATAANHGHLTPMPCVPNTPFPWMNGKNDVLLKGQPALLKSSSCKCVWGGTITLTYDGQTEGNKAPVSTEPLISFSQTRLSKEQYTKELEKSLPDNISPESKKKIAENMLQLAKKFGKYPKEPMSIEEADKQSANPNYEPGTGYSVNCATVAAAYALRLKGLDVVAKPNDMNMENGANRWLSKGDNSFKMWKNADGTDAKSIKFGEWMIENTDNGKPINKMTPELYNRFIEENTKEEGVYIINVGWKEGRGGHATIIQRWRDENGELNLSYIEPQVYEEKYGVKHSINGLIKNMEEYPHPCRGIMRVDDKIFDSAYTVAFKYNNENT